MKTIYLITVEGADTERITLPRGYKREGEALQRAEEINQACPELRARVERSEG